MENVLVITGGSAGIGAETAKLFAQNGWHVYELSRSGQSLRGICHISTDISRPEEVKRAF